MLACSVDDAPASKEDNPRPTHQSQKGLRFATSLNYMQFERAFAQEWWQFLLCAPLKRPVLTFSGESLFHMYTLELHPTCLRVTVPDNDCCTHVRLESREVPLAAVTRVTLSSNDMLSEYGLEQLNVWMAGNTEESGPALAIPWLARPLQARDTILHAVHLARQHEYEHEHGGASAGAAAARSLNGQQHQQQYHTTTTNHSSLRLDPHLAAAEDVAAARASATGLDGAVAAAVAAASGERPKLGWSVKGGVGCTSQRSDRDRDSGGSGSMLSHSSSDVNAAATTSELASFYLQRSLREMALMQPPAQQQQQQRQMMVISAAGAVGVPGQAQKQQHQAAMAPPQGQDGGLPPPHVLDLHVHHHHHHHHLHHLQHQQHHLQHQQYQQQLDNLEPCMLSAEQHLLELMAAAGAEQALGAAQVTALAHAHLLSMSRAAVHIAPAAHDSQRAPPLPPLPPRLLPLALHQQHQQHNHDHSHGHDHDHGYHAASPMAAGGDAAPQAPQLQQAPWLQLQQEHDPELFGAAALGLDLRPLRVPARRPIWPTARLPLKTHHRPIAGPATGTAGGTMLAPPPQAMVVAR